MSRPFDDDRWPEDHTGHAVCFLCGRKVDPLDPGRGSYSPNAAACEFIPIHLPCASKWFAEGKDGLQLLALGMKVINELGAATIKHAREAARVSTVSPLGT